jgi:DNA invertase Pin-like site-specific DNA recombinase
MVGKKIGYIRVSSVDQNTERQLAGYELDRVFEDKVSGKDINRPQLIEMISYVRDGDEVIIHSMDRLARNVIDLKNIVEKLTAKEVTVRFIKENLLFTGKQNPLSNLLLSVIGAVVEFERALINERQAEGIAIAKEKGIYKGRKLKLDKEKIEIVKQKLGQGVAKARIAKELKIDRKLIYRYIKIGLIVLE